MNKQQLLYIQTLFNSFNGKSQMVNVTDEYGNKMNIEIYPSNNMLAYRVHFEDGSTSLWNTWEDKEHVANYFRSASLV